MLQRIKDIWWSVYFLSLLFWVTMKWHWIRAFWLLVYIKPFKGKKAAEEWSHQTAIIWGKEVVERFPLWEVELVGSFKQYQKGPYIFIANHESALDILTMYLSELSFKWLSKKQNFWFPIIGFWMKQAGYISVDQNNPIKRKFSLDLLRSSLREGDSVFIFPEGSRSKTGEIADFKLGAFRLSVEENIPIVPIVFCGAGKMMKAGTVIPKKGTLWIFYGKPMYRQDGETFDQFAKRVREVVVRAKEYLGNTGDY